MTLSDQEIRRLQLGLKVNVKKNEGEIINVGTKASPEFYQIVYRQDSITQAMAVVPVDSKDGANPNYQETTIVVAGTQTPAGEINHHVAESLK